MLTEGIWRIRSEQGKIGSNFHLLAKVSTIPVLEISWPGHIFCPTLELKCFLKKDHTLFWTMGRRPLETRTSPLFFFPDVNPFPLFFPPTFFPRSMILVQKKHKKKKKSLVIARIDPQVQVSDRRYGPATRSREPEWLRPWRADENRFEFFLAHYVYARSLHPNLRRSIGHRQILNKQNRPMAGIEPGN